MPPEAIEETLTTESDTDESVTTETAETEGTETEATGTESEVRKDGEKEEITDETTESTEKVKEADETKDESEVEPPIERVVPKAADYTLPEGVPIQVAQFANEADMTQEQLDTTLQYFGGYMKATNESQQKVIRESGDAFVEGWGKQKPYNLSLVRRALSQNDPDGELRSVLNSSGYGNHPAVLAFFLRIGNSMKEGGFLKGSVNRPAGQKTAAQTLFGKNHMSVNS